MPEKSMTSNIFHLLKVSYMSVYTYIHSLNTVSSFGLEIIRTRALHYLRKPHNAGYEKFLLHFEPNFPRVSHNFILSCYFLSQTELKSLPLRISCTSDPEDGSYQKVFSLKTSFHGTSGSRQDYKAGEGKANNNPIQL